MDFKSYYNNPAKYTRNILLNEFGIDVRAYGEPVHPDGPAKKVKGKIYIEKSNPRAVKNLLKGSQNTDLEWEEVDSQAETPDPIPTNRGRFGVLEEEGDWGSGWGAADDDEVEEPRVVDSVYVNRTGIYNIDRDMNLRETGLDLAGARISNRLDNTRAIDTINNDIQTYAERVNPIKSKGSDIVEVMMKFRKLHGDDWITPLLTKNGNKFKNNNQIVNIYKHALEAKWKERPTPPARARARARDNRTPMVNRFDRTPVARTPSAPPRRRARR